MLGSSCSAFITVMLGLLSGGEGGRTLPVGATSAIDFQPPPIAPPARAHPKIEVIAAPPVRAGRVTMTRAVVPNESDLRFVAQTDATRRYEAGAMIPQFYERKRWTSSASVESLRLDPPRVRGTGNGGPLATRLQLRITGDAHSMDADFGVRGSVARAVERALDD